MTGQENDKALREAFAQARGEDAAETPAFARVWEAARARRPRRVRPGFRLALAGLGALAFAAVLLRRPAAPSIEAPRAQSIMDWKSPTGFLLQTSGGEIMGMPAFGRGLPDYSHIPVSRESPGSSERKRPL